MPLLICKESYCPKNSGGGNYGFVSLQQAFAKSYNTPAVRLLDKTGVDHHFKYLEFFGFKKITEADYRLASALAGFTYGVSPLELTGAYTSFHEGYYPPPRAIRNITTKDGQILYSWDDQPVQVWKKTTVNKMRTLLRKRTIPLLATSAEKQVQQMMSKIYGL